ncbi:MAG: molybdopterin converting factor subunit 1 [Gammaproteobacteria bacterium]|nr:molybdopterin converting factor subunit 1 [Gammaproteobacteria bacterium]
MIKIKYFARLSESLGVKSEELEYAQANTAEDIIELLITRGEIWADAFSGDNKILVAVNQQMCERNSAVRDGDEVAFFPPVTGG